MFNFLCVEIPEWLKVLVVCASWLHHSPQLQLTAISTLLDLISLLRSQCEAAESAGHQGVVAVVMVPLLRSRHISYIENHTNVVQVLFLNADLANICCKSVLSK